MTLGAAHAASTAALCSAHERTLPDRVTVPSSVSTDSASAFESGVALERLLDRVPDVVGWGRPNRELDLIVELGDAGDVSGDELGLVALELYGAQPVSVTTRRAPLRLLRL
jgi:hypothetical protein